MSENALPNLAPPDVPDIPLKPPNLRQKLSAIMGEIGYLEKRGRNEKQGYRYAQAADIAGTTAKLFAEHGVAFLANEESIEWADPRPTSSGGKMYVCQVHMRFTILDSDSDETLEVRSTGEGQDTGDKAIYKAKTGALKYALQQSLLIATGDDPEADDDKPPARDSKPIVSGAQAPAEPRSGPEPLPRTPSDMTTPDERIRLREDLKRVLGTKQAAEEWVQREMKTVGVKDFRSLSLGAYEKIYEALGALDRELNPKDELHHEQGQDEDIPF